MSIFNKIITALGWIALIFICIVLLIILYIIISNKIEAYKRKKQLEKVRKETLVNAKQEEVHKTEANKESQT